MATNRIGSFFFHAAMLALAVAAATYWVVRLMTPAPAPPPPAAVVAPPRAADPLLLARLFGQVPTAAASSGNVQVTGVYAAGARSAALLAVDGKPARAFVVGQEVTPGLTLKSVEPTRVVLDGRGTSMELSVPPPPAAPVGGAPAPAAPAGTRQGRVLSAPSVAQTPPSGRGGAAAGNAGAGAASPPPASRPSGQDGGAPAGG